MAEESGLVDLRQEIGRLINAIVAVVGPELAPRSTFFSRCKVIYHVNGLNFFYSSFSCCQQYCV